MPQIYKILIESEPVSHKKYYNDRTTILLNYSKISIKSKIKKFSILYTQICVGNKSLSA